VTVRLEELLAAATPGEWEMFGPEYDNGREWWHVYGEEGSPEVTYLTKGDAALIAKTPDAVRLLIDMGNALRKNHRWHQQSAFNVGGGPCICEPCQEAAALLARLDRLGT